MSSPRQVLTRRHALIGALLLASTSLASAPAIAAGWPERPSRMISPFAAGAGVEYQLENRHYAFGGAGQWMTMPGFDGTQGVTTRLYLRYTY